MSIKHFMLGMLAFMAFVLTPDSAGASAGPILCAACITAASAACVGGCVVTGPAYLFCVLECEVAAAFGGCALACASPTP